MATALRPCCSAQRACPARPRAVSRARWHAPAVHRDVTVAAKGKGRRAGGPQTAKPPVPPVDEDNEEFVIFVRAAEKPKWNPISIVKGGNQANVLVRSMKGKVGNGFFGKTLKNNLASV